MTPVRLLLLLIIAGWPAAHAETALVAVAASAAEATRSIGADFQAQSGHRLTFSVGSTGKLYAQIRAGAPFDLLLAADDVRPQLLVDDGLAVPGSLTTYAVGSLILWARDASLAGADGRAVLRQANFRRLAIANPELAPYGAAARSSLQSLGLWDELQARIVRGENVGQAAAMVASGNAEFGLIAASQAPAGGSSWPVPASLHAALRQDAVLLKNGADNSAAQAFLTYLTSAAAADRWRAHGFDLPR